ncbi:MAG: DNA adenine methylase, partial [Planctomycetia bacterium]
MNESPADSEDPRFLQEQLITCIGNKRALLAPIGDAVDRVQRRLGKSRLVCLDLFSGTGVVARFLKRFSSRLIVNDLETYSRLTNDCHLTNRSTVRSEHLALRLQDLNAEIERTWSAGFLTKLYAPKDETNIEPGDRVFYTRRNAEYLDTARRAIDGLPADERKFFLAPLLAAASVHVNTAGVFKGFYKNEKGVGQFGGSGRNALSRIQGTIQLESPVFSNFDCDVEVCQADANELVRRVGAVDLAYF